MRQSVIDFSPSVPMLLPNGNTVPTELIDEWVAKLPQGKLIRDAQQYLQLHITECGGTSFLVAFQRAFPDRNKPLTFQEEVDWFEAQPESYRHNLRWVHIHVKRNILHVLSAKTAVVSMVRDPVQKAMSSFYWQVKHRGQGLKWVLPDIEAGMPFEEWITTPSGRSNIQHGTFAAWVKVLTSPQARWETIGIDMSVEAALEAADRHCAFIGLTEAFDASVFTLAALIGLPAAPMWEVHCSSTSSRRKENLDTETLGRLEEMLADDIKIYNVLRQRFYDRYGPAVEYFNTNVGTLKRA
ncbi:hypothetical protein VY88_28505 [Azospirillum thiophilum]|nr:hypothetical protein VY88_28505 [Azospirillum thiophilum]